MVGERKKNRREEERGRRPTIASKEGSNIGRQSDQEEHAPAAHRKRWIVRTGEDSISTSGGGKAWGENFLERGGGKRRNHRVGLCHALSSNFRRWKKGKKAKTFSSSEKRKRPCGRNHNEFEDTVADIDQGEANDMRQGKENK